MGEDFETTQVPGHYQIPTHLDVPDKIALSFLGLGVEVTMRQGLICLFGGVLAYRLWHTLSWLSSYGAVGASARLFLPGLVFALAVLIAVLRIADRSVETWLSILLNYALKPKAYKWTSIIHDPNYRLYEGEIAIEDMEQEEEEV